MISMFIKRKGIWLFVFAIAWYLAGCFINKHLEPKSVSGKKEAQHFEQKLSVEAVSELSINAAADCAEICDDIFLIFDPSLSQIEVDYEGSGIGLKSEIKGKELKIVLDKAPTRKEEWGKKLFIKVPANIHRISLMKLSDVEVSGFTKVLGKEVELVLLDSESSVDIADIKLNSLSLVTAGVPPEDACGCEAGFKIKKKAVINNLRVTMPYGHLKYYPNQVPQHVVLNVGDDVEITGHKEFIKIAQINSLP